MAEHDQLQKELGYYKRRVDELAGENLRLDYTISGLRHELKQKRQGFALLSELQQSIGAAKEISSIFEIAIESINSTLGMDRTVVLVPTDEHHYRPAHWLGFREEMAEQLGALSLAFPPEFAGGAGLLLVNKGTERTEQVDRISAAFDLPFFICVPVMGEAGPIGLLLSGRLKEVRPLYPPLDRGDVDTFLSISGLISAVIRNMRVAVLEEMDRLKTDFFANISHEFRTPIALTIGPMEQLLAGRYGELPETAREQLGIMRRNQERLLGLVNQILDLAKLEAGGMELRAARLPDVNRFVEERVAQFRPAAEKRGIELRTSLDPRAALAELYVDREKLDRLLFNLLSNAIKFTKAGHIEVSTQVQESALRLAVTDTGIGIKEDQLPHIFDRFRQADGSEAREYAGTGIGLALAKEVAQLHGGDVTAYSQYGKGSSFRVSLPLGREHLSPSSVVEIVEEDLGDEGLRLAPEVVVEGATDREGTAHLNEAAEVAFDPDRPTVVYAEDNPDLRTHVHDLLAGEFNLFMAADGREGLEQVRKYRPDLVISDQMMPGMSGRDLLRSIREDPELRLTPVIFLTARVGTEARIASLDAGADDYLTKPFHQGELLARARNLVRARRQERQLAELNRRLEVRVEEQMAELVRSGELKRFLPPAIAEGVLSGQLADDDQFERRKITILAAYLSGLADLTEGLEPEELSSTVNDYLRELSAIAIAHGGTVESSAGQGLTVFFGAPKRMELEEQAWAAVQAAVEMRTQLRELTARWRRRGVAGSLDIRIGLNSGYCTVGVFGSDLLRSYTAIGTPVTVATLLEEEAAAGEILCAFPTYALVEERVRATPRGALELRAIARPVEAFELLGLQEEEPSKEPLSPPQPVFLPK